MQLFLLSAAVALLLSQGSARAAEPIAVVAAENFYGDVARQIGGPAVMVTNVLNNPDQDPHLFEASPSVARALGAARIVVYNGIDYDPWIEKLLGAARGEGREVIVVADLVGRKRGDNPHIWYDPATMPALATALAAALSGVDPTHRADYQRRLGQFRQSLQPLASRIAALRLRLVGTPVAATEPVFGYMLGALGMQVIGERFQLAVMNNTEPRASDVAAFEDDLRRRRVGLLVYNQQASGPVAQRMVTIAQNSHIPVVAVTETLPLGTTYQAWIASELDAVDRAVAK